ncbi:MAG: 30S ribosome-binding factor RbfA [bacterium]|nr:30S ribosome-binding factor RbfA [bacterium]
MKRLESMAEVIKEELAQQILREVELPEGVLLTITRIEITDDKQQAKVLFSLLGGSDNTDAMRRQILDLLFRATPFLQRMLNRQLRTRPVPRIRFLIDEEELKRQRIEELLGQVEKNEL